MSRLQRLQVRRRVLIERCAVQRAELAGRLAALDPFTALRGAGAGRDRPALPQPLAWAAALAALLLLGRTREILTFVLWLRSALSLAARVAQIVRLVRQRRAPPADGARRSPRSTPAASARR